MQKENKAFWNAERTKKAQAMKLTPIEVTTLASIVDEETANNGEKPMVAGMYYNRLMLRNAEYPEGMPLQADPTIKFAWKRFDLKRIYNNLLYIKSPYNTYKNPGLPIGPICNPGLTAIEAALEPNKTNYYYFMLGKDGTTHFFDTEAAFLAFKAEQQD